MSGPSLCEESGTAGLGVIIGGITTFPKLLYMSVSGDEKNMTPGRDIKQFSDVFIR